MRIVKPLAPALTAAALALGAVAPATAQTAQAFSIQGSGLVASLFGNAFEDIESGFGGEVQLRYTPGAFSVGVGFQYTSHGSETLSEAFEADPDVTITEDLTVTLPGGFIEPRYVISVGSDVMAPYLSARLSVIKESGSASAVILGVPVETEVSATGILGNGGGGFLFALGEQVNLDVGLTVGFGTFRDQEIKVLSGGSELQRISVDDDTGGNTVIRVGLAIGLGG